MAPKRKAAGSIAKQAALAKSTGRPKGKAKGKAKKV
eukprot:CAMPEP_0115235536 /NCGR_PEP_ID=MMETSP0270-20121206/35369_1 /TAXON_ID=71861 /ORGANISM="Scrippsiella trochoidea, Strain CCMP3099" /LENGTH=35 /DNA_ID= /DNA_START= /DNA_END= /DNA_ORIENTATION=